MSSRARDFLPGLNVSRRSLLSRRSRRSTASSTCQQPKDGTTDDSDIESDDLSFYHDNENCFRKLSQTQSEEQVHKFLDAIINDSRETKFDMSDYLIPRATRSAPNATFLLRRPPIGLFLQNHAHRLLKNVVQNCLN